MDPENNDLNKDVFLDDLTSMHKEPTQEIYEKTTNKVCFGKFLLGLIVVSLVGGGSIGASFAILSPYVNDYYYSKAKAHKALTMGMAGCEQVQGSTPVLLSTNNPVVEIAKNIGPCVVSINNSKMVATWFGEFNEEGIGSGVIFKQGPQKIYIITNAHVVEGAQSLNVNFWGNTKVEAELIGQDDLTDLAVVAVSKEKLPPETLKDIKIAPLGDSSRLQVGEIAVAIGTPIGETYNNTVTGGYISALNRKVELADGSKTVEFIQTDAAINAGNSGGALVGPTGEVVGINSAKLMGEVENIGFAIPINAVKPIINEILQNGKVARPSLGIVATDISAKTSEILEIPKGIYIEKVFDDGSADLAGIQQDDILFELEGAKITSMTQFKELLDEKKVGDSVQVKILRGNDEKLLKVKLKEAIKAF